MMHPATTARASAYWILLNNRFRFFGSVARSNGKGERVSKESLGTG